MSSPLVLRTARILSPLTALGPGRRVGVWVQGCTLACAGCASADTWDRDAGREDAVTDLADRLVRLLDSDPTITGLSVTGGEPAQQAPAVAALLRLLQEARLEQPREIDVLLFSAYDLRVLHRRSPALLDIVDAVVAGPYHADLGYGGPLLGSANQRLHLLTDLARRRHVASASDADTMQVTMVGGELLMVGIPRPGHLDLLRARLAQAGVVLGDVSWTA